VSKLVFSCAGRVRSVPMRDATWDLVDAKGCCCRWYFGVY
jgi:hypothetical protein